MPRPTPQTHPNADAFPRGVGGPVLRALANAGIRSLSDLSRWRRPDVARLHGVGPKGVRILEAALAERGMAFSAEPPADEGAGKSR